jgi:hypothetical protein
MALPRGARAYDPFDGLTGAGGEGDTAEAERAIAGGGRSTADAAGTVDE